MTTDSVNRTSPDNLDDLQSPRARLFRIYNYYRVVISLILTALLFVDPETLDNKFRMTEAYEVTTLSYLGINLFLALVMMAGAKPNQRHITLSILIDIIVLHSLLISSVGMTGGLANLVIVSVAAGNILTPSRMGLFYAALAAIGSLGVSIWSVLTLNADADEIVRAGSLGILYFAAAFILQSVTRRMLHSEELATSRARSLLELEQINQQIIQRMRTGIVVTDRFGDVRLGNAAAHELLFGERDQASAMQQLPPQLRQRLDQWIERPGMRTEP
ncbi:MAG: histidine kinase, partial [Alteromonadaceae bacterium]|nr:histidine kinase [Alteromonadaceae bacterium]